MGQTRSPEISLRSLYLLLCLKVDDAASMIHNDLMKPKESPTKLPWKLPDRS